MPTYTLTITALDGHEHTTLTTFGADADAIADTKLVLTPEHPSVAVARGSGDDVEFLGVWDYCGGDPQWTADENA